MFLFFFEEALSIFAFNCRADNVSFVNGTQVKSVKYTLIAHVMFIQFLNYINVCEIYAK